MFELPMTARNHPRQWSLLVIGTNKDLKLQIKRRTTTQFVSEKNEKEKVHLARVRPADNLLVLKRLRCHSKRGRLGSPG
jgi:hypothetical protein